MSLSCTDSLIYIYGICICIFRSPELLRTNCYGWASVVVHCLLTSFSQELLGQSSLNSPNLVCSICRVRRQEKFKCKIYDPPSPPPHTHTHTDHRLENAQISECVENVYMRMRKVMIFFIHNIKSLLPSLRIKMVKIISTIS